MARLRAVLIGCGHISRSHVPGWLASPDAELVAVCDLDQARARERAAEFGIERVYTDPATMLQAERPDCVDIATRPATHQALIELAASQGVHVLCQKPLAPTLAEADAMAASCERAGVRLMVNEMWRWLPWYRALAQQLATGAIGPVHFARFQGGRYALRRTRPINDTQPYFADMPLLIIYEMIIHWIDAVRFLFGDVSSVYARLAHINPAIVGEDVAQLLLGHQSGTTSLMDHSWGTAPERPEGRRREGNLLIEGRDGSYRFDDQPGHLVHLDLAGAETVIGRYKEAGDPWLHAFAACIGHFAAQVRSGQPFESDYADNRRTLAVTLAAYESAAANAVISLR